MPFKVIKQNILKFNEDRADKIRRTLDKRGVFMVNIISSPGSGKTTLLEKVTPLLKSEEISFAILAGDCFTSNDAVRLDKAGAKVTQINTGNACHIDAQLIQKALKEVNIGELDFVIVENVGNMVCPAEFDLGEDCKIALLSVPEGHDKPLKYPLLFKESELVIINKLDLLKQTDFDLEQCEKNIFKVNPKVCILKMSCRNGRGINAFVKWIKERISNKNKSFDLATS
ncbi:MAG: hydrogenase nickel incorporation protein HypB [Candidatus Omnitrophota bacterium]